MYLIDPIPEPAPSTPVSVTVGDAYQPFEIGGEIDADDVGLVRSTLSVIEPVVPVLPCVSVDQNETVFVPSDATGNGPAYVWVAPPLIV